MITSPKVAKQRSRFRKDLERMINVNCMENGSNTPDFILANFLMSCLTAFDIAVNDRTSWHDNKAVLVKEE